MTGDPFFNGLCAGILVGIVVTAFAALRIAAWVMEDADGPTARR